ncbi:MAG: hypothetical protein ABJB01_09160 [Rudaea sp.]
MRTNGRIATRCAAMFVCGVLNVLMHSSYAASDPQLKPDRQTVVVSIGRTVLDHKLPDVMQIEPGRFVTAHDVQFACATSTLTADSIVLFFPNTRRCEQVDPRLQISLRNRLHKLTGQWQMDDPVERVKNEPFIAIAPPPRARRQTLVQCGCAVDQPPDGVSMCSAQTRTEGTPIGPVEFLATDADTPALTGNFSYQRDSNPATVGLPPEVTSSCSAGSGTLQCTLSGTAPSPAGVLQFTFDVSDGTFTLPLESRLEVLAAGDRVFSDNFESPGCP